MVAREIGLIIHTPDTPRAENCVKGVSYENSTRLIAFGLDITLEHVARFVQE